MTVRASPACAVTISVLFGASLLGCTSEPTKDPAPIEMPKAQAALLHKESATQTTEPFGCRLEGGFAFSAPRADVPAPYGRLEPRLKSLATQAAARWMQEPERVLGPMLNEYRKRRYQEEETHLALLALREIVTQTPTTAKPRPVIVAHLDPLCSHCQETWSFLRRFRQACRSFPKVEPRLLPANTTSSRHAAAVLRLIQQNQPDKFEAALSATLAALPTTRADLDRVLRRAGVEPKTSSPLTMARTHAAIADEVAQAPLKAGIAPVVLFRGRRLELRSVGNRVYEPLDNPKMLFWTLALIEGVAPR